MTETSKISPNNVITKAESSTNINKFTNLAEQQLLQYTAPKKASRVF